MQQHRGRHRAAAAAAELHVRCKSSSNRSSSSQLCPKTNAAPPAPINLQRRNMQSKQAAPSRRALARQTFTLTVGLATPVMNRRRCSAATACSQRAPSLLCLSLSLLFFAASSHNQGILPCILQQYLISPLSQHGDGSGGGELALAQAGHDRPKVKRG